MAHIERRLRQAVTQRKGAAEYLWGKGKTARKVIVATIASFSDTTNMQVAVVLSSRINERPEQHQIWQPSVNEERPHRQSIIHPTSASLHLYPRNHHHHHTDITKRPTKGRSPQPHPQQTSRALAPSHRPGRRHDNLATSSGHNRQERQRRRRG